MGRITFRESARPDYKGFYLSQVERKDGFVIAYVNSEEDIDTIKYAENTTLIEVKEDLVKLGIDIDKYHVLVYGMDDELVQNQGKEL